MFPITCSAVGDIATIIGIANSIVKALSEARGSAKDHHDLEEEIQTFIKTLSVASGIITAIDDDLYCAKILELVGKWTGTANDMLSCIEKYALLRESGSTIMSIRARLRQTKLKLRWEFLQKDEAIEYRKKLAQCRGEINLALSGLSVQGHIKVLSKLDALQTTISIVQADISVVQQEIATLPTTTTILSEVIPIRAGLGSLGQAVRVLNESLRDHPAIRDAAEGDTTAAHDLAKAIVSSASFLGKSFEGLSWASVPRPVGGMDATHLSLLPASSTTSNAVVTADDTKQPIVILALAIVTASAVNVRMGVALASFYALLRFLMKQQRTIPSGVAYSFENTITLIDLLGRRMHLTTEFCTSLEALHHILLSLFLDDACSKLIQGREYEIIKEGEEDPISSEKWKFIVQSGIVLEMSAVLVQKQNHILGKCPCCGHLFDSCDTSRLRHSWTSCISCDVKLRSYESEPQSLENLGSSRSSALDEHDRAAESEAATEAPRSQPSSGIEFCRRIRVILGTVLTPGFRGYPSTGLPYDASREYVIELHNCLQSRAETMFLTWAYSKSEPSRSALYTVAVYLDARLLGTGQASSKKEARKIAAYYALNTILA